MPAESIHAGEYRDDSTPHRRIRWTPGSADLHLNLVDLRYTTCHLKRVGFMPTPAS